MSYLAIGFICLFECSTGHGGDKYQFTKRVENQKPPDQACPVCGQATNIQSFTPLQIIAGQSERDDIIESVKQAMTFGVPHLVGHPLVVVADNTSPKFSQVITSLGHKVTASAKIVGAIVY